MTLQHHALERGAHDGARELELGQGKGMLGVLGLPPVGLVLLLADQAAIEESLESLHLTPSGVSAGARPRGGDALLVILQLGQGLVRANPVALLHQELPDHAAGACDHGCAAVRPQRRRGRVQRGDALARHGCDLHRDGLVELVRSVVVLGVRRPLR